MKVIYLGPSFAFDEIKNALQDSFTPLHISDYNQFLDEIKDAFGIVDASMKFKIDRLLIQNAKNLRVISCATTGSDHIDANLLKDKGIVLHTLREDPDLIYNLTPAAELSWALLMACARMLPQALKHVRDGKWNREDFPSITLKGKQLGIIGLGRIGSWMSRYAAAFDMKVVAYDPAPKNIPNNVRMLELKELLEISDFISVHVPLNNETKNLISEQLFKYIKPGAILINTSRGGIINENALLNGLLSGRIRAAGLDVLEGEPKIEGHPLLEYARTHDNLLITPHCGGFSPDAVKIVCAHAAKKINKYF